jgi:hypothetical protein
LAPTKEKTHLPILLRIRGNVLKCQELFSMKLLQKIRLSETVGALGAENVDNHKKNRVAVVRAFLERYEDRGDDFLDCIVAGDETWVSHHTPENKRQSMQ